MGVSFGDWRTDDTGPRRLTRRQQQAGKHGFRGGRGGVGHSRAIKSNRETIVRGSSSIDSNESSRFLQRNIRHELEH